MIPAKQVFRDMNLNIGKYLLTGLWFFAGNVIALDSGDPPNTDILNQIENYHSSTCQLIFSDSYTCSGVLINNTSDQGRPLILTAAHCIESEADLVAGRGTATGVNGQYVRVLVKTVECRQRRGVDPGR